MDEQEKSFDEILSFFGNEKETTPSVTSKDEERKGEDKATSLSNIQSYFASPRPDKILSKRMNVSFENLIAELCAFNRQVSIGYNERELSKFNSLISRLYYDMEWFVKNENYQRIESIDKQIEILRQFLSEDNPEGLTHLVDKYFGDEIFESSHIPTQKKEMLRLRFVNYRNLVKSSLSIYYIEKLQYLEEREQGLLSRPKF